MIRTLLTSVLGQKMLGRLDYVRFPERANGWGGPFNGQERRREIFDILRASLSPTSIIETGTFLGTTTEFFGATGLPVFTVEGKARNFGFASARLRRFKNVHVVHGDSRAALRKLLSAGTDIPRGGVSLLYLDAHWNDDLPLSDEIDLAFSLRRDAVVMVDDFEVPGDPGYGFDDYGPGRALNAAYIHAAVERHDLAVFYPAAPSHTETGVRRGCVVLAKRGPIATALQREPMLREANGLVGDVRS